MGGGENARMDLRERRVVVDRCDASSTRAVVVMVKRARAGGVKGRTEVKRARGARTDGDVDGDGAEGKRLDMVL